MTRWVSWRQASRLSSATSCRFAIVDPDFQRIEHGRQLRHLRRADWTAAVRGPGRRSLVEIEFAAVEAAEVREAPSEGIEPDQLRIQRADTSGDGIDLAIDLAARRLDVRLLLRERANTPAARRCRPTGSVRASARRQRSRPSAATRSRGGTASVRDSETSICPPRPVRPETIWKFIARAPLRPAGNALTALHGAKRLCREHVTERPQTMAQGSGNLWQTERAFIQVTLIMSGSLKSLSAGPHAGPRRAGEEGRCRTIPHRQSPSAGLPEALRPHLLAAARRGPDLVVIMDSAAWTARVRYAGRALKDGPRGGRRSADRQADGESQGRKK